MSSTESSWWIEAATWYRSSSEAFFSRSRSVWRHTTSSMSFASPSSASDNRLTWNASLRYAPAPSRGTRVEKSPDHMPSAQA